MAQIKLLNSYWKENSPFGTYLQGDSIDTYWDTDTVNYYVTYNTVAATSGADIPPTFTYNGENQDYYLTRTIYQASICDSTTLLTFQLYPLFPYLFKTNYNNHPTCELVSPGITPTTCDLNFDALAVVTDCTTSTSFDGQIVVSASGSNGAVQYRLNADFAYGDGTAQTSGTFTALGKGNYLVYCRDENNCLAVLSVTVKVQKSYGIKYQLEYYDSITGNFHHKTQILEKDYAGALTEVCGGDAPTLFTLRGEGEKDKFTAILPTEITFSMLSETDGYFQDLYTNDPEKYRIRHSIDSGAGYEVVWIGKMLPNQYEESFVSSPYIVNAVAIDGLTSLQDFYFLDDANNRLTGQLKVVSVIAWILKKIGLEISIRVGCNIYATGMATTAASDPLDQSYIDVSRYYLIQDVPTCWDVLKYILETFNAQIILYYNVWNIIRVEERIASFDYRVFNYNGVYASNSSYNPVKNLKNKIYSTRLVWRDQSQLLKINPGYGTLRLIYNLGLKPNIFINGDFAIKNYSVYQNNVGGVENVQGTIPDMEGFLLVNNGTVITTGIDDLGKDNVAIQLTCDEIGGYLQSEVLDLKLGNAEGIKLTFKYMAFNRLPPTASILTYDPLMHYIKVKVKVRYGIYYLLNSGGWTTVDSSMIFYVTPDQVLKYQTFEVTAITPVSTYISGEEFQVFIYTSNAMDYDYGTFAALRGLQTYNLGPTLPIDFRTEAIDTSNPNWLYYYQLQNNTSAESAPDIIRPTDYNVSTNPVQWIKVAATIINTYDTTLSIDKIEVQVLSKNKNLPEIVSASRSMENENTLDLNRIIYHGSIINNSSSEYRAGIFPEGFFDGTVPGLFEGLYNIDEWWLRSLVSGWVYTANSADIAYSGYLMDTNGVGYTTWARDAVPGSLPLETIYQDVVTAQYNKPWRSIHGPFTGDILFSPLDVINEQTDPLGARIYFPIYLEIDYKYNSYNAQFLELTDVTNSLGETGAAFTIGFSLGYKS